MAGPVSISVNACCWFSHHIFPPVYRHLNQVIKSDLTKSIYFSNLVTTDRQSAYLRFFLFNTQSKISLLRGINKELQRLLRMTGLCAGPGVGNILQSWGHLFSCPWQNVCQITTKNFIGHELRNVAKL